MRIQSIDYSVNLTQAILWQYNAAENLQAIINKKQEWYDVNQTEFWENWFDDVFNLQTANDFGLSVWSIILGMPFLIATQPLGPVWGFNEVPLINTNQNFEHGNFSSRGGRIVLNTEDQRLLLQLRYYQLTSRGERPRTNQFLDLLFNNPDGLYQGGAWMLENLDMTIDYVFNCAISEGLLNAIIIYDVLPQPTGVAITNYIVT